MKRKILDDTRRMLKEKTRRWAEHIKVEPTQIRVQTMTRKWASCSTTGWISLAVDLADQPNAFQDYVIVHELLHLRVPNHGKLFKSLLTVYLPEWRATASINESRRITCSDQRKSPLTEKSAQ